MKCVLCNRAMTEYRDYYRCKHDNLVHWKDHSKEGKRADLFKRHPVHPIIRWLQGWFAYLVKPEILIFITLTVVLSFAAFMIGVLITLAEFGVMH